MSARQVVALPRPKGTRKATKRAQLVLTMHPRQLRDLEARAKARSMTLAGYVRALLDDDDDAPRAPRASTAGAAIAGAMASALSGFMFAKGAEIASAKPSDAKRPLFLDWLADRECPVCSRVPGEGHKPGCTGTFPEVTS